MGDTTTLAEELRRAIAAQELNRHRLAQRAGLSYSVVHGFMRGCDITMTTMAKLCAAAGVSVVLTPSERCCGS